MLTIKSCEKRRQGKIFQEANMIDHAIYDRYFYAKSILLFSLDNYKNFKTDFITKTTYDGKFYVCMTHHERIMKTRTSCQAVFNKLDVKVAPNNLTKLEKMLKLKRPLFKKFAIMHGKEEETDNIFVLPRPVIVKLKQHLRYPGYLYLEPVHTSATYEALNYLKRKNKFYEDISISHGLNSQQIQNLLEVSKTDEIVPLLKMKVFNQWVMQWMLIGLQATRQLLLQKSLESLIIII